MALLTGLAPGGTYFGDVFAGAVLTSIGMGFSLVPLTIVAMRGLPNADSGLGSGLLNTSRLMGGALGLAILSTIAASYRHGHVGLGVTRALTNGFDLAMIVGAVFLVAGALVAGTMLRSQRPPVEPVIESDEAERRYDALAGAGSGEPEGLAA
jgi:hypothetical protein